MPNAFTPGTRGKCPHCGVGVQFAAHQAGPFAVTFDDSHLSTKTYVCSAECPSCHRPVVSLNVYRGIATTGHGILAQDHIGTRLVWPQQPSRACVPTTVPVHIQSDYNEAASTLADSPKASAALSRRCLQAVLRDAGGSKSKDLADQIDEVIQTLPSYLQKQLDAVRNIGNFAAHPQKSKTTGEIIDVEPGEAEWNLDVLDLLFDFYYEQPRISQEKRDALDKKLAAAGKPPMK